MLYAIRPCRVTVNLKEMIHAGCEILFIIFIYECNLTPRNSLGSMIRHPEDT